MACRIKELAEYILANHNEKSNVWKQVNAVMNPMSNIKNEANEPSTNIETSLDEELKYLNSKKTIQGKIPQKIQKAEFKLDNDDTVKGVIHQMLDGTRLGYAKGVVTELSSGKGIPTNKGSLKARFTEAITKLKTISGSVKEDIEKTIKDGVFNKEVSVDKNMQMSDTIKRDGPELSNDYIQLFKKSTKEFINATTKIDNNVMLDALRNDVNSIVPADYNKDSNTIRMIDNNIDEQLLIEAMQDSYDNAEIEKIVERNPEQERILKLLMKTFKDSPKLNNLIEAGQLKQTINRELANEEYIEAKKEYIDDRAKQLVKYVEGMDRGHAEVHELVHAAAYKFMTVKQTEQKAKAVQERINLLFEEAKRMAGYTGSKVHDPYWTQNVHEFIAEALSNPAVMKKLDAMPIENKLVRLSTVLRALVDALVSLVSTGKNKDSVYAYTMDGLMALMEVQQEQQKQEADIIQPSEVFTKNINKMMKC